MRGVRGTLLGAVLLGLVGCGGAGGGSPGPTPGPSPTPTPTPTPGACSVTLSGALTRTIACTYATVIASYLDNADESHLVHSFLGNADSAVAGLALTLPGRIAPGTYTETTARLHGVVSVGSMTGTWTASVGVEGIADGGSFRLVVDEARPPSGEDLGLYTIHGTLEGTLPARTGGASGTVTLHATF